MTISTTTNKVKYVGDGATQNFSFSFKIFNEIDLKVVLITIADGTEAELTLSTNYTVAINPTTEGGSITTVGTYSNAYEVLIKRVLPRTQGTAFPTESNIPEAALENGLDKAIMVTQEIDESLDRAVLLAEGSDFSNLIFPEPLAGKAIVWNSGGTALENSADDLGAAATAQAAAEAAQTAAETAQTGAETAETNAAASAAEAAALTGTLDIVYQNRNATITAADFTKGNDATPDNAGTGSMAGILLTDSITPFYGNNIIQFFNTASSLNDFALLTTNIGVPTWAVGTSVKIICYYKYTGSDNDLVFLIHDATNDTVISSGTDYVLGTPTPIRRFTTTLTIPSTCVNLKYGFHVKVANNGKIFNMGPLEITRDV